jgi:hypothetical protein
LAGRLVTPFSLTVAKGKQWYLVYRDFRKDQRDFATFQALAHARCVSQRFVSLPALKGGASRFTGHCLSSNVLLRSYAASTGRTGRSTRPPVFRQTPLLACEQRHWIVAKFAPFILSLKGEAFRCVWVIRSNLNI